MKARIIKGRNYIGPNYLTEVGVEFGLLPGRPKKESSPWETRPLVFTTPRMLGIKEGGGISYKEILMHADQAILDIDGQKFKTKVFNMAKLHRKRFNIPFDLIPENYFCNLAVDTYPKKIGEAEGFDIKFKNNVMPWLFLDENNSVSFSFEFINEENGFGINTVFIFQLEEYRG